VCKGHLNIAIFQPETVPCGSCCMYPLSSSQDHKRRYWDRPIIYFSCGALKWMKGVCSDDVFLQANPEVSMVPLINRIFPGLLVLLQKTSSVTNNSLILSRFFHHENLHKLLLKPKYD